MCENCSYASWNRLALLAIGVCERSPFLQEVSVHAVICPRRHVVSGVEKVSVLAYHYTPGSWIHVNLMTEDDKNVSSPSSYMPLRYIWFNIAGRKGVIQGEGPSTNR